jgi:hypothetical protein
MDTAQIKRMWADHRRPVFPADAKGRDVRGVDLVLLDSLAAGCIDAFVVTGGSVEPSKLALLENLATQLRSTVVWRCASRLTTGRTARRDSVIVGAKVVAMIVDKVRAGVGSWAGGEPGR